MATASASILVRQHIYHLCMQAMLLKQHADEGDSVHSSVIITSKRAADVA